MDKIKLFLIDFSVKLVKLAHKYNEKKMEKAEKVYQETKANYHANKIDYELILNSYIEKVKKD